MTNHTSIETLAAADWDALERDVVLRIRVLKVMCKRLNADADGSDGANRAALDKLANDLVLPNVELLGAFCTNVSLPQ